MRCAQDAVCPVVTGTDERQLVVDEGYIHGDHCRNRIACIVNKPAEVHVLVNVKDFKQFSRTFCKTEGKVRASGAAVP